MLVVADLHLEKGSSYAARGQMLPPYDTRETLRRLAAEVAALVPAFGAYAGGLNILDPAYAGMFARPPLTGALGADRVHAVGWRSLRGD